MKTIRIATRNSPLALWQAKFVKDQLLEAHAELSVEIVGMTTQGDQLLDRSLVTVGGKGLFLKELEMSLLNKETDIAVHSMKDVPVDLPRGLEIAVVCERADARDAFVSNNYQNLYALPSGSRVGTSSMRRVSQLKSAFPALEFVELRGNVNTRLEKLDRGEYEAIILAVAGLTRLGLDDRIKQYINTELCLPAVGQGIVGIECRSDDIDTVRLIAPLHNKHSAIMVAAERSMNASLEGGCQVPVAGHAEIDKGKIHLRGMVGKVDGTKVLLSKSVSKDVSMDSAEAVGQRVAEDLLKQGAGEVLAEAYREPITLTRIDRPVVLLTRQQQYLGNSVAILQRLDYTPMHIPTIDIKPRFDSQLIRQFEQLDSYTDLVFISRNAVAIGMSMIEQQGQIPDTVRVMAIGSETAKQLFRYGVSAMYPDQGTGAEALLKVDQLQDMAGRRVLLVRGELGLDWPAEEMRKRGAEVYQAKCYSQDVAMQSKAQLSDVLQQNPTIGGVFIHSTQSLHNLLQLADDKAEQLCQAVLVAGSDRIAQVAGELGWKGKVLVAQSPANKHMMIAFSG